MIKDITTNEIILLAYNELPPGEHRDIMLRVKESKVLTSEYNTVLEGMRILDNAFISPHPTSVEIIKEESCSSSSLEMI
tara:strand:+ start:2271 stop:2507 length:237 start_codon:yes stop_codon:yes gene_type:complete